MNDRVAIIGLSAALKAQCRVATTANISLSGLPEIDGYQVRDGDRVLVKDQTDTTQNGIWVASTGNWRRATDFNDNRDLARGGRVFVVAGDAGRGEWELTTDDEPIIIDESEMGTIYVLDPIAREEYGRLG